MQCLHGALVCEWWATAATNSHRCSICYPQCLCTPSIPQISADLCPPTERRAWVLPGHALSAAAEPEICLACIGCKMCACNATCYIRTARVSIKLIGRCRVPAISQRGYCGVQWVVKRIISCAVGFQVAYCCTVVCGHRWSAARVGTPAGVAHTAQAASAKRDVMWDEELSCAPCWVHHGWQFLLPPRCTMLSSNGRSAGR